jgi:predicted nucleic acid-binding Zn ribbon protein
MFMKNKVKFCPRCGTPNNLVDAYCIKCGYNFKKRRKKSGFMQILVVILLIAAAWVGLRLFLKKPIIPTEFIDLVKNMTLPK